MIMYHILNLLLWVHGKCNYNRKKKRNMAMFKVHMRLSLSAIMMSFQSESKAFTKKVILFMCLKQSSETKAHLI